MRANWGCWGKCQKEGPKRIPHMFSSARGLYMETAHVAICELYLLVADLAGRLYRDAGFLLPLPPPPIVSDRWLFTF